MILFHGRKLFRRTFSLCFLCASVPLWLTLFFSCANRVNPTGGEKDILPPKAKKFSPENFSVQFRSAEIVITFDEYIQLKELQKQLIVSPLMDPSPEVTVRKKNLVIKISDTLQPNTTYTLNFGKAIADIREGNPAENFQYVFSTGSHLDSLFISGKVMIAENHKTEKDILVMLYRSVEDSAPSKQLPDYFSRTAEDGTFRITNIGRGPYKIFALKDGNNNYLWDRTGETIAFGKSLVFGGDSTPVDLRMFLNLPTKTSVVKSFSENPGKAMVIFNRSVINPVLSCMNQNSIGMELSERRDTMVLWVTDTLADSLQCVFYDAEKLIDTVKVVMKPYGKNVSGKGTPPARFLLISSNSIGEILERGIPFILFTSSPVLRFDSTKISLIADSIPRNDFQVQPSDSGGRKWTVTHAWKDKVSYTLILLPGAFTDIFSKRNDTLRFNFMVREEEEYASLTLNIEKPDSVYPCIIQLTDENSTTVYRQEIISSASATEFFFITPGKYRIRLIEDMNGNRKWDTGNYFSREQPENVIYFPDVLQLRANWDLEQRWILQKETGNDE